MEQEQAPDQAPAELDDDQRASLCIRLFRVMAEGLGQQAPDPVPQVFAWLRQRFVIQTGEEVKLDDILPIRKEVEAGLVQFESVTPEPRPPHLVFQYYLFKLSIAALYGAGYHLIKSGSSHNRIVEQAKIAQESFLQAHAARAVAMAGLLLDQVLEEVRQPPAPRPPQLVLPTGDELAAVLSGRGVGQRGVRG
jgi:hypothetical protein